MRITTKYTSRKNGSSIIVAKCNGKQKTFSYDQRLSPVANHRRAAQHFAPLFPGVHLIEHDKGRATFTV